MNSKVARYLTEALASAGCAVVDSQTAYKLRPDIWASAINAGSDFSEASPAKLDQLMERLSARLYVADFSDGGSARVAARSAHMLAERIEWQTGKVVRAVRLFESPQPEAAAAQPAMRRGQERLENQKELAGMEPPTHDCAARRDILAAREELGRLGIAW